MSLVNCKLIADVTIISDKKILLVKYKNGNKYDHQSGWFLPDDLINEFEHPEAAAERILKEQLNITGDGTKLSFIESFKGNDKSWHLVFHYKVMLNGSVEINPSTEVDSFNWFETADLPDKNDVAHHGWALYTINEILK